MSLDKRKAVEKIRESLARDLAVLRASVAAATEGATHEEAKPEDDKDTRALEQSYLAGAQAARARNLEALIAELEFLPLRQFRENDPISLSAMVETDVEGERARYFLCSAGGGLKFQVDGVDFAVVTPEAPLGQALLGKRAGDSFELRIRREERECEIVSVE